MRTYIIGNDGIALCRKAPATVSEGEIVVASKEELHAAPLQAQVASAAPWFAPDSLLEGTCVDALRGSRAFLASDCHAGCGFVSGLFARPMAAGLDGLSACRGSHLDFALDAHPLAPGLPR